MSCWAMYRRFGISAAGALHMIVSFHLCALAGTDIAYNLLPNKLLLSALGFSCALRLPWPGGHVLPQALGLDDGLLGACLGFGLLCAVSLAKPGAIGGGDVKMAGVIGFYLGFPGILYGLLIGFALAAVYTGCMLLAGRLKPTDAIPLGVFLSVGAIWTVAVGIA